MTTRTWLLSSMEPEVYSPGGTTTVPPPAAAQASIARWIAGRASSARRPVAPWSRTSKRVRSGAVEAEEQAERKRNARGASARCGCIGLPERSVARAHDQGADRLRHRDRGVAVVREHDRHEAGLREDVEVRADPREAAAVADDLLRLVADGEPEAVVGALVIGPHLVQRRQRDELAREQRLREAVQVADGRESAAGRAAADHVLVEVVAPTRRALGIAV